MPVTRRSKKSNVSKSENASEPEKDVVPKPAETKVKDKKDESNGPRIWIFVLITLFVACPKIFTELWSWYNFRSGWVRPFVNITDEKQVLILGTVGSGKMQMSYELGKMGLEVSHSSLNSASEFVRDGTVSTVHALRFITQRPLREQIAEVCKEGRKPAFHPTMFRPSTNCSPYSKWDRCWMLECAALVVAEHGCSAHPSPDGGSTKQGETGIKCFTPFRRALLQVRHPLSVIGNMMAQFGGKDPTKNCTKAKHHLAVAQMLFPEQAWEVLDSCVHKFALSWLLFNKAMLPHVDHVYRVENTPPCTVAELAGFTNETDVVYPPNLHKVNQVCSKRALGEGPGQGEDFGYINRKNNKEPKIEVSWKQLEGAPYPLQNLRNDVQHLARELGYAIRMPAGEFFAGDDDSASFSYISDSVVTGKGGKKKRKSVETFDETGGEPAV